MKTKNAGITIIIAMGTSLIVLALAFATLDSVRQSLEQANNIQRSTQLFFASESGLEAAFFHHNARGAGASFTQTDATQTIDHPEINAESQWSLIGRSTDTTGGDSFYADILSENQTIQLPLQWDSRDDVSLTANISGKLAATEDMTIHFYRRLLTTGTPSALTPANADIRAALGTEHNDFAIENASAGNFDFGDPTDEVLIDWSLSRKNSSAGVETFIPVINEDCANTSTTVDGFICESQLNNLSNDSLEINTTNVTLVGKILPGLADTNLSDFWSCSDAGGGSCSDFRITFRPLLGYTDSIDGSKILGIPYSIVSSEGTSFPLPDYTVNTDVTQEDFSQAVNLQIPERTSIGVFDYVIFD